MQNQSTDRPRLSAANIKVRKPSASDDTLVTRLRAFDRTLHNYNKHERAITLIMVCISEGVRVPTDIARHLIALGFKPGHVRIMINEGRGNQWRKNAEGHLVAMAS